MEDAEAEPQSVLQGTQMWKVMRWRRSGYWGCRDVEGVEVEPQQMSMCGEGQRQGTRIKPVRGAEVGPGSSQDAHVWRWTQIKAGVDVGVRRD